MLAFFKKNWFYFVFLIIGVFFVFLIPPFQKPDEVAHFDRAVNISYGDFFCKPTLNKSFIPNSYYLLPEKFSFERIAFNFGQKFLISRDISGGRVTSISGNRKINSICGLPFWGYLFSGFILFITRLFNFDLLFSFYLGRLISFLLFFICVFFATKIIDKKYLLFLRIFVLLPMVLQQVSAYSYDSVQLSLIVVIFSFITNFLIIKNKISLKKYLFFCFSLFIFILVKPGYYLFLLLYFLIPVNKSPFSLRKYIFYSLIFFVFCFFGIVLKSKGLISEVVINDRFVVSNLQIQLLIEYPFRFFKIVFDTLNLVGDEYIYGIFGLLGWNDYRISLLLIIILSNFFGYSFSFFLKDENSKKEKFKFVNLFKLVILLLVIIGTFLMVFLSLYIYWSHTTNPFVEGVQGRYFLVLIPLIVLFFGYLNKFIKTKYIALFFITICFTSVLFSIYNRYYNYSSTVSNIGEYEKISSYSDLNYEESNNGFKKIINISEKNIKGLTFISKPEKNMDTIYIYKIMDYECKKTLREGVLLQDYLRSNNVYYQYFKTIKNKNNQDYCVKILPFNNGNNNLKMAIDIDKNLYLDLLIW